ncbi:hypothetical protein [Pseudomonas sp. CCC3.1]|uniref:hypothetical protein n=1 Tax=Pseudomonas sp. CCC3.1 TaxID=3048607 RepID=UPI002AC8AD40|nr:hypothetical protein [Pseudomonas sp. CCC3.1]MEB0204518.1 hypothetical protein [Pseudomonas sp. CCC3.1]WPX38037.1 hypothetical protein RHM56_07600 [Pseudomonas sp. CCC3.1]
MPTKSLRILIADADRKQALNVEIALNRAGYFRVAPLHRLEELTGLGDAQAGEFDLLLISQAMAGGASVDAHEYHRDNAQFRHIRIYRDADVLVTQIDQLMQSIDPLSHT